SRRTSPTSLSVTPNPPPALCSADQAGQQEQRHSDQSEQNQQAEDDHVFPNALRLLDHHAHRCLRSPGCLPASFAPEPVTNDHRPPVPMSPVTTLTIQARCPTANSTECQPRFTSSLWRSTHSTPVGNFRTVRRPRARP